MITFFNQPLWLQVMRTPIDYNNLPRPWSNNFFHKLVDELPPIVRLQDLGKAQITIIRMTRMPLNEQGVNMILASFVRKDADVGEMCKELGDVGKDILIDYKLTMRVGGYSWEKWYLMSAG